MSDDKFDVTVEDAQERDQLRQALARVRWVEKAIQLRYRCAETPRQFSMAELSLLDAIHRFDGKLVTEQICKNRWVLVVLERMVNVHGSLGTTGKGSCAVNVLHRHVALDPLHPETSGGVGGQLSRLPWLPTA
jgi:hypothetical protein